MNEHKNKLISAKVENNCKAVVEVLLSLRVNALQISPELRKNLGKLLLFLSYIKIIYIYIVYELIRNDVFLLTTRAKN